MKQLVEGLLSWGEHSLGDGLDESRIADCVLADVKLLLSLGQPVFVLKSVVLGGRTVCV